MELRPVVEGDGSELLDSGPEGCGGSLGDGSGLAGVHFVDEPQTGLSFYHCQGAVMLVAPHEGVPLPQTLARFDLGGPLGDVALARQNSTGIPRLPLAPPLGTAA